MKHSKEWKKEEILNNLSQKGRKVFEEIKKESENSPSGKVSLSKLIQKRLMKPKKLCRCLKSLTKKGILIKKEVPWNFSNRVKEKPLTEEELNSLVKEIRSCKNNPDLLPINKEKFVPNFKEKAYELSKRVKLIFN